MQNPIPCRRKKELPPNFTPRRSNRIARSDCGLDSETKAKHLLRRHLGLTHEDEPISAATLAKYEHLFEHPLAEDVIQAFADIFCW